MKDSWSVAYHYPKDNGTTGSALQSNVLLKQKRKDVACLEQKWINALAERQ